MYIFIYLFDWWCFMQKSKISHLETYNHWAVASRHDSLHFRHFNQTAGRHLGHYAVTLL